MPNLETIQKHLAKKLETKPAGMAILPPESNLPPDIQAVWLIGLLMKMYTVHGISNDPKKVTLSIENGDCRCWFITDDGEPIACAAQVRQSDGAIELGRGVAFKSPSGSLAMLSAAVDHLTQSPAPLVAEVRAASEFAGIPSGLATQNICLHHLGLIPHALVPAFGHGSPHRQEPFVFATNHPLPDSNPVFLPHDQNIVSLLSQTVIAIAHAGIAPGLETHLNGHFVPETGWEIATTSPFAVIVPSSQTTKLETAAGHADQESAFTLIPMEASPQNSNLITVALNAGFVPCGIDRNLGQNNHPVILFGRLRRKVLLAPAEFNPVIPDSQREPLSLIDSLFRVLK